jgi:hypothetical protein
MTNTGVKCKKAHIFTVAKFFFVVLFSENVRRPLEENFGMVCPKIQYMYAESVSVSESVPIHESKKFLCGSESEKKVFGSATLT